MKKIIFILLALTAISLSSCVVVADGPGPSGYPGRAYFGISYDYYEPYSYWDNNPAVPNNPYFDEYYPTGTGIYDFEYFVNRDDYWFGTYEIWINRGEPGRPYGEPGRNGIDSFLMLVCNDDGPYEYRKSREGTTFKTEKQTDGSIEYTIENGDGGMKIKMQKTSLSQRIPNTPKYTSK